VHALCRWCRYSPVPHTVRACMCSSSSRLHFATSELLTFVGVRIPVIDRLRVERNDVAQLFSEILSIYPLRAHFD
jgi:hypothetical protein